LRAAWQDESQNWKDEKDQFFHRRVRQIVADFEDWTPHPICTARGSSKNGSARPGQNQRDRKTKDK
jgi:hypothetical protein